MPKGRWGLRGEDLIGRTFGRLTVIGIDPVKKDNRFLFVCQCSCGNLTSQRPSDLKKGKSTSCGCFKRELDFVRNRTHGESRTRFYGIWQNMRKRCSKKGHWAYLYYGGKGISVCKEWNDFSTFSSDMKASYSSHVAIHGESDTTLERKNTNGPYSPDNCRWATRLEQANNKSNNHFITHNGITLSIAGWARRSGIDPRTLWNRLFVYNWPFDKAIAQMVLLEEGENKI